MADRVTFEVAPAHRASPGTGYDLVTTFDALHDMGDPVGAARHVREALADDGTWMVVEPMAGDRVEDNLNPVGRAYYGFSTLLCTPGVAVPGRRPRARHPGRAGAGSATSSTAAGFTRFRIAAPDAVQQRARGRRDRDASATATATRRVRPTASRAAARTSRRRRARRRAAGLRGRTASGDAHDRAADADLVDHRLAVLEGAGRPTWPGTTGWSRSTAAGSGRLGPAAGAAAYTDGSTPPTPSPCMDATGTDQAVLVVAVLRGGLVGARRGRRTPTGCSGIFAIAPSCGFSDVHDPDRDDVPWDEPLTDADGLGASTTSTTGSRAATTTSCSSSSRRCSPSRTRPSRSRTASAGAREIAPQTLVGHHRRAARAATARSARRSSRSAPQVHVPGRRACTAPTTGSGRTRSASGWPS